MRNGRGASVEKHSRETFLEVAADESIAISNGQKGDSPSLGNRTAIYYL